MGSPQEVERFLDSGEQRYVASVGEDLIDEAGGSSEAVVFVKKPTDAVKSVAGSRVVGSLDRDTMWEIVGFSLSRRVVSDVLVGESEERWLAALAEAGCEIEFIEIHAAP